MNPSTVFHRPLSEYAFALDDTHYVFRLRTGRGEAESCRFYYADRAAMTPELDFSSLPMEKIRSDRYFDWYEIRLETALERIAYYFCLFSGTQTLCYYGDCYEWAGKPARSDYFQLPFNHRADRLTVPQWTKDAVVYNIFPDSFAPTAQGPESGSARLGGTIRGITEKLDYISGLGCDCIYLNPIFTAGEYHKYDTLDYYSVDPCMGTNEDLRHLVISAHARHIRVILDGVFNHMSCRHPMFQDVLQKGSISSCYPCFYQLPEHPALPEAGRLPAYTCFSYVANMPKTNTADPFLRKYFCDVGAYWVREFDIDGWRLDVANELDDGFLRAFRCAVKEVKAEAVIVGEVWENASHYLNGDMLDSAMNYDFRRYCQRFFAEGSVDAQTFDANISTLLYRYKEPALYAQLNLLDSHDVSRFFSLCGEDPDKMELAVLFLMTFPGMPCVFYGDEKGLSGLSEFQYRREMSWKPHPLEAPYRAFIGLRNTVPALRYGAYKTLLAHGKHYAYARTWGRARITVAMNLGAAPMISPFSGTVLLKKGSQTGIIGAWEYEIREESIDGGDDL